MAIMDCYLDRRAIENELGGKWDLFLSESFEEDRAEGFEFPTDFDGTPLTLNGIMIIMENTQSVTYYLDMDGESRGYTQSNRYATNQFTINNGAMNNIIKASTSKLTYSSITAFPTVIKDRITNFKLSSAHWYAGTSIKVYVLRGV